MNKMRNQEKITREVINQTIRVCSDVINFLEIKMENKMA